MNFNDVAIVSIKGNDYRVHFWCMSKDDAISIMNNSGLDKKKQDYYNCFSLYIKIEWNNLLLKKQRSDVK